MHSSTVVNNATTHSCLFEYAIVHTPITSVSDVIGMCDQLIPLNSEGCVAAHHCVLTVPSILKTITIWIPASATVLSYGRCY